MAASFGELLKQHRTQKGLSQVDLAKASGLSPSLLSRIEKGTRKVGARSRALRFAQILGLDQEQRDQLLISAEFAPESRVGQDSEEAIVEDRIMKQAIETLNKDDVLGEEEKNVVEQAMRSRQTNGSVLRRATAIILGLIWAKRRTKK